MTRDLPPLNALRAFEAAARHLNFTRASEELFVTQSAVSRQIKLLEDTLQQVLFVRDGPRIELTPAGERYRDTVRAALALIRRGTAELCRRSGAPTLTVSVLPSFATLWLVPRVIVFQSLYPNIELRITSSYDAVDFSYEPDVDAAVRLGRGDWSGLYTERLFDAARLTAPMHTSGARDSDQQALQQAAIEDQGIALAHSLLVEFDLRAGRLVRPIDVGVRSELSYWFVCPDGQQESRNVRSFLEWLRQQSSGSDNGKA